MTTGGPVAGQDGSRGVPLARRDAATREAIAQLDGVVDGPAVTAAWESAVRAPEWPHPGVWIHGDLLSGNVLVDGRGRLSRGDRLRVHGRGRPGLRRDGRLDAV